MALTAERSCLWKTHEWCEMWSRKIIFLHHLWTILIFPAWPSDSKRTLSLSAVSKQAFPFQASCNPQPLPDRQVHGKDIYLRGTMSFVLSPYQCQSWQSTQLKLTPACSSLSQLTATYLCDATGINSKRHQIIYNVSLTGTAVATWSHFFFLCLLPLLAKWRQ